MNRSVGGIGARCANAPTWRSTGRRCRCSVADHGAADRARLVAAPAPRPACGVDAAGDDAAGTQCHQCRRVHRDRYLDTNPLELNRNGAVWRLHVITVPDVASLASLENTLATTLAEVNA